MIESLIWNIRGITSKGAFDRLKQLKRMHNLQVIGIMEPFSNKRNLDKFKRRLSFEFAFANCTNKIWLFCDSHISCNIIEDMEQQVTFSIEYFGEIIHLTLVYAKCTDHLRQPL